VRDAKLPLIVDQARQRLSGLNYPEASLDGGGSHAIELAARATAAMKAPSGLLSEVDASSHLDTLIPLVIQAMVRSIGSLENSQHPNPSVLSRLYLSAVLPCMTDLVDQDPKARDVIGKVEASIALQMLGGPAATVQIQNGRVACQPGVTGWPSVRLLFFSEGHLNAFFSGKKWAVPLPVWGCWRVGLLARFSKLAEMLEATLNGEPQVLAAAAGRRLHARLTLIAAGLGLQSLAQGDTVAMTTLRALPHGLATFNIEGESQSTVWFDHGSKEQSAGWSEPPRRADVSIAFSDVNVAYAAMRDEIDSMAAVGTGAIKIDGLIPLADGLNFVMERLRVYLQP
jgi:hypothetical protein